MSPDVGLKPEPVLLALLAYFFFCPYGVGGGLLDYDATWEGHDASYHAAFRNNSMSNVSAQATWNAFLPCKITDLGQDTLTWIRQGDFTILTSGRTRYTSDDRFIAHHNESLGTWTLQIKYVQPKDAGTYECQISTKSGGIISALVNLEVVVPKVFILGNEDFHVNRGSIISIVCIIEQVLEPPDYVFWYRDGNVIGAGESSPDPRVRLRLEPGVRTHSRLEIRDARTSDTGNYTCSVGEYLSDSVFVFVEKDKMSAIQAQKGKAQRRFPSLAAVFLSSSLLWIFSVS